MKMETAPDVVSPLAGAPTRLGTTEDLSPGLVDVKVEKAADLDEAVHDAVTRLLEAATEHKTGIMVTRVGVGRYTVQTHSAVPFGLIRQRHV
jgi:hypothetical protein